MYSNVEKSQYLMLVDFSIKKSSGLYRMEIQTGKTLDLFSEIFIFKYNNQIIRMLLFYS